MSLACLYLQAALAVFPAFALQLGAVREFLGVTDAEIADQMPAVRHLQILVQLCRIQPSPSPSALRASQNRVTAETTE